MIIKERAYACIIKERHPMGASLCFVFHRATTDSQPRDAREKSETKKSRFFDQKRTKITYLRKNTCICQKIVVSLHPIGCIAQRVRIIRYPFKRILSTPACHEQEG